MFLQPKLTYLNDVPPILYRYFELEYHADIFAAGKVWISTLDACRRYEGEHRLTLSNDRAFHYLDELVIQSSNHSLQSDRGGIEIRRDNEQRSPSAIVWALD